MQIHKHTHTICLLFLFIEEPWDTMQDPSSAAEIQHCAGVRTVSTHDWLMAVM